MIRLAPTTAADFEALVGGSPHVRFRGVTAHVDGAPAAIGGLAYHRDGAVIAFLHGYAVAPRFPIAVHRAVVAGLRAARARGERRIHTVCDTAGVGPAAARWLERLGFVPTETPDVWVWEA